jgi:hypothetical protein
MLSIQFWLNSTDMAEWKKKTIMTVLGSFIVRMLTLPIFMLFEMFNRSTEMSFAARKPAFVEK